ncbi:MAG: hypothetical protein LBR23_00285 [Spirochaetaceae bacterium]|jgi:hypothetical protein|nr:hypothetical protein [Spirochaetaceae bacterium]
MKYVLCLVVLCAACSAKNTREPPRPAEETPEQTHLWYGLSPEGFTEIPFPSASGEFVPWTVARRVCDSALAGGEAYFLVNKLGLIAFGAGGPVLFREDALFSTSTVDSLTAPGGSILFHRFRDDFFSGGSPEQGPFDGAILLRFDSESGRFLPLFLKDDAGLREDDEVTAVSFTGEGWYCQIKRRDGERVQVDYRLYALGEGQPAGVASMRSVSQDRFWGTLREESFPRAAPEELAGLLPPVPEGSSLYLECRFAGLPVPRRFSRNPEAPPGVNGHAAGTEDALAVLLEDGTVYFRGALPGFPPYLGGEAAVFKLPSLPQGFVYGHCVLAGGKLYAAWEEKKFYQTGRSGFVQVNLDALLYGGAEN